jgi:ABC-type sugar transport system permease subunit
MFDRFSVWRWTAPGLALMALMVVYPLVNTVLVAFTNYGDGHLGDKNSIIQTLQSEYYKPADGVKYKVSFFSQETRPNDPAGVVVWLVAPDGKVTVGSTVQGLKPEAEAEAVFGKFGDRDANGVPKTIGNRNLLGPGQVLPSIQFLTNNIKITSGDFQIRVDGINAASQQVRRFVYDPANNTLLDKESGLTYIEKRGEFVTTNAKGEEEALLGFGGWPVGIGVENFTRAITSENVRGPFFNVFLWTAVFAVISVFTTFALGLLFAIVLTAPGIPLRGIFRTVLVIPYALPAFISILVWKGMLQPDGVFTRMVMSITGSEPKWFDDAWLAKFAILAVNLWLGYPYMMLITMGALQSIPGDLYEAATIDGANYWAQFRNITVPLLLVAVGPLLIGSFAYNFNNFAIIELMTAGGPKPDAAAVAGQTDILISYTYRLAFGGTKGIDYGFASAITIFIFLIVAAVTAYNFRLSRRLEQVYSNG